MRKLIACLLVTLMLVCTLPLTAVAEETTETSGNDIVLTDSGETEDNNDNNDTETDTSDGDSSDSSQSGSGDETTGSGETTGTGGRETDGSGEEDDDSEESGSDTGTTCTHAWVYVEVPSTCTEYGAKGYYCSICEAVTGEAVALAPHTYDHACDTSCNVCGGTREIAHKFSSQWSKNSTKHWHACTVCGAKDEEGSHYPGPAATEEKAQYCLTCGLMMMPQKAHVHTYAVEYTSDETGHWYACSGCQEKKDFQEHTYDSLCDPDCNDCGYTTAVEHYFENGIEFDASGHWGICSFCGESAEKTAHIPGPEATDTSPQLCSKCGYELAPALTHVHKAEESWEHDEAKHWKVCSCGEPMEEAAHSWEEADQEENSILYICRQCGEQKLEEKTEKEKNVLLPLIIVLVILIIALAAAVIALIMVLKGNKKTGRYKK